MHVILYENNMLEIKIIIKSIHITTIDNFT